jgi:ATP-dependent Lhr-like helicase
MLDALWDLVWSGEVTNDTFAPLRLLGPAARRPARGPRLPRLTQPRASGRWSLVGEMAGAGASPTERMHALAGVLLQRHGVLTREAVVAEGWPGGFAGLYPVLRAMEESGRIRRGYFVEGLGGSQFALPGAVDRLRSLREPSAAIVALAASDPANAYGAVLPWPRSDGRMARAAGAYCVLDAGELVLYLERGGRSLLTNGEIRPEHVRALMGVATKAGRVEIQRVDGVGVMESPIAALLREAGFASTHRGLVAHGGASRTLVGNRALGPERR